MQCNVKRKTFSGQQHAEACQQRVRLNVVAEAVGSEVAVVGAVM
jgi:hypothetical protein